MNDIVELLTPPPERDLPAGRLEVRRDMLLRTVEADLRARRPWSHRFGVRGVRAWLLTLALLAVVAVGAAAGSAHASRAPVSASAAVRVAVAMAAPAVMCGLAVTATPCKRVAGDICARTL